MKEELKVKVRKKMRDEEGGENQKMKESDYVQMSRERKSWKMSVGDLIYRNKRKERRLKKYLPNLSDDLPGTLACSTLLWRRSTHRS